MVPRPIRPISASFIARAHPSSCSLPPIGLCRGNLRHRRRMTRQVCRIRDKTADRECGAKARAAWSVDLHREAARPVCERAGGKGNHHVPLDAPIRAGSAIGISRRKVPSRKRRTRSARVCYPCLRYKLLPVCPGQTTRRWRFRQYPLSPTWSALEDSPIGKASIRSRGIFRLFRKKSGVVPRLFSRSHCPL